MLTIRLALLCGASLLACSASVAHAQTAESTVQADAAQGEPQDAQDIVVLGKIGYRNRSDSPEPVLVYDTEYFQRFEPLTIGDALKRVPSVTFLSDVIESDGARLRGLDPGYTQILINGERVPGSNADRSFFLDRIPAELVDRVEIVRSNSARRTADAVAGTLNIVLRDAYKLDGGYVRTGGLLFDDGEVKPSLGLVWGGQVGPGRLLIGGTVQGRYNPKKKRSLRYSDSPENNPDYATEDFDNREDQSDVRDGRDYNANASYALAFGGTKLEVSGFFVKTDRKESERSFEYDDPTAETGPVRRAIAGNLLTDNRNIAKIDQNSYNGSAKLSQDWSAGKTSLRFSYAAFNQDRYETEDEIDFDRALPRLTADVTISELKDREFAAGLDHSFPLAAGTNLQVGGFLQNKDRDQDIRDNQAVRNRRNLTGGDRNGYDQFFSNPSSFVTTLGTLTSVQGGLNQIKEQRRDLFGLVEGKGGGLAWEAGVRLETTDFTIDDLTAAQRHENDYNLLLPSASLKYDLSRRDRFTASVARTNRRPRFDYLSPALLEAELGDNDLLGNPNLKPETAWGVDVGYERRLGRTGVAGVNVFYRKVSDLVEVGNTGEEGSEGEGTFVLQPQNSGDGKAWGIEFDLSASLGVIGLRDTGVFGNLALLDSKVEDFAGKRRFNGQSKYVFNAGFIQSLPSLAAAFGVTYRKQGAAIDRIVGEEIRTTYGGDLEIFVEKSFFNRMTIRAVGSNLLNGKKKEVFNKFTTIEDQLGRDLDEYELEEEKAGPVFQLVARLSF